MQLVLDSLTLDDACLAVEYTAAMPANSNALGRIGRLLDHVRAGIPTVYGVPTAGYEGRDEGRGQDTSATRGLDDEEHQERIARNEVLPVKNINQRAFHFRELSRWVPLYALCLADSYSVPCAVVLLPETVKTCPPIWRHSGAELRPLYDVIAATLVARRRLQRSAPAFRALRTSTEAVVGRGTRARPQPPPEWQTDVARHGHPNGARRYANGREHLPFSITEAGALPVNGKPGKALLAQLAQSGSKGRVAADPALPASWTSRRLLLEMTPPPEVHWREKTYVCRLLATELCFLRSSVTIMGQPWAMSSDPRSRDHVLAVPLPVSSALLWEQAQPDVYVRRWVDFADLLLLRDGVFLGNLWSTNAKSPIRVM